MFEVYLKASDLTHSVLKLLKRLTEKKLESKCSSVMNMSTRSTRPPSCMYCFGELSPIDGTPANMLFPSERDSASSSSSPPPRARFLHKHMQSSAHAETVDPGSDYEFVHTLNVVRHTVGHTAKMHLIALVFLFMKSLFYACICVLKI